jgi:hypothetical protein
MSGDTILAIIAVSLTAIFISVFAIECDRVWQRYRAARRREMEERPGLAAGKTEGGVYRPHLTHTVALRGNCGSSHLLLFQ